MYGMLRAVSVEANPDEGQHMQTLELVREAVQASDTDVSAVEVAEVVGISRSTAQRYLSHLQRQGEVHLRLRYGVAGRPEHRYSISR